MTKKSTRILPFCLIAILIVLVALACVNWAVCRLSTVQHYRDVFSKVDRVIVNGIRADRETGQIVPIQAEVTNTSAIGSLSKTFFDVRDPSGRANFSYSPPIAGTRLHITVRGFSGNKAVCEFEVIGSRRIFFNKYLWLDTPEAELPEAIHRACEVDNWHKSKTLP